MPAVEERSPRREAPARRRARDRRMPDEEARDPAARAAAVAAAARAAPPERARAAGTASAERKYETASAIAIVSASGRKNAPATPVSSANGKKMTIVERLEPVSGGRTSASPERAGSAETRSSAWRAMFSTTTIASSATRPIAAAMPPSVIRLIVWPDTPRPRRTIATVTRDRRDGDQRDLEVAEVRRRGRSPRARRRSGSRRARRGRSRGRTPPGRRRSSTGRPSGGGRAAASKRSSHAARDRERARGRLADDVDEDGGPPVRGRADVRRPRPPTRSCRAGRASAGDAAASEREPRSARARRSRPACPSTSER